MSTWTTLALSFVIALPLAARAQNCDQKQFADRTACGVAYDKCYCQKCPTTAKCGGTTYGCTGLNPCRDARTICGDKARGNFNACARAAQGRAVAQSAAENAAAFNGAAQRVNDAKKWLPGSLQGSVGQVAGAVGDLKKSNVKMTGGVWARIVDAVRAILRGPKALAEAIKKLSPVEILKMEEQKAWTGN
ncbi:MAG: hypothetical protein HYY84_06785 [Deltaproteobacteria bacterium]|nr:hypothetical protein [Deltaproteobacteria bacterium]